MPEYFDSFNILAGFTVGVIILLMLDLIVLSGKDHHVGMKEAGWLTAFWTLVAAAVGVWVFIAGGEELGVDYVTAYVAERALSVDNLFVFLVIFGYFGLPDQYRSRALLFGIIGALVARGIFIVIGIEAIQRFEWVLYILGGFLVYTAYKLATAGDDEVDPSKNIVLKLFRRVYRVSDEYDGHNFTTVKNGLRYATPFAMVVIVLATTDVVFAIDSIPTVFGISHNPFIVWSSNAMAVLGMRPLFFLLEGLVNLFRFLSYGLAAILAFIGIKMIAETAFEKQIHDFIVDTLGIQQDHEFLTLVSLGVIITVLVGSVVASLILPESAGGHAHGQHPTQSETDIREHDESAA